MESGEYCWYGKKEGLFDQKDACKRHRDTCKIFAHFQQSLPRYILEGRIRSGSAQLSRLTLWYSPAPKFEHVSTGLCSREEPRSDRDWTLSGVTTDIGVRNICICRYSLKCVPGQAMKWTARDSRWWPFPRVWLPVVKIISDWLMGKTYQPNARPLVCCWKTL